MKRFIAPFLVGFISIQAQTLLMREYLVLFGGSELSIGIFMAGWFLWIGMAAVLFARVEHVRRFAVKHTGLLLGLWPLCIALEVPFLRMVRDFTGAAAYEPVPPGTLLIAALLATMLTSAMTGVMFPAAAARIQSDRRRGTVQAYWMEAVGAVLGGAWVTVAIALSVNLFVQTGFLTITTIILTLFADFYTQNDKIRTYLAPFLIAIAGLTFLVTGRTLDRYFARLQLASTTKGLAFVSRTETPYRVLTLARSGTQKSVLSDDNMLLTWPFTSRDQGLSAFLLAQTQGHDFLALGIEGLRLVPITACKDTHLTVVFPDRTAFHLIEKFVGGFGPNVRFVAQDPRVFVTRTKQRFDAVLVAGGEPSVLVANRLYTVNAFRMIKRVLRKNGVLAVPARIPQNFVGPQFREYGSTILASLHRVFMHTGIVPGAGGLFVAGNRPIALGPAQLIAGYKKRGGLAVGFPANGFYGLLKPERQAFLRAQYQARRGVPNTDAHPTAFYLKLLTLLKLSALRASVTVLDNFRIHGRAVLLIVLGVVFGMLLLGRFRLGNAGAPYGVGFATGAMGAAAMGMVVLLMAGFQSVAGTLFQDLGVASAAFMLGLVAGAWVMERIVSGRGTWTAVVYCVAAGAAMAAIAWVMPMHSSGTGKVLFFALFGITGVVAGGLWPVISHAFRMQPAASLETWDHLGAAVGAAIFGVLVLPVLGLRGTGVAAGALLGLAGAGLAMDRLRIPGRLAGLRGFLGHATHPWKRTAIVLTGLTLLAVLELPYLKPPTRLKTTLPVKTLHNYETFSKAVKRTRPFVHYELSGVKQSKQGAVLTLSAAVAPDIKGFAGPINLLISIDKSGVIRKVRVLQSNETPAYVVNFPRFLKQFEGHRIDTHFVLGQGKGIDAMTGATITSRAAVRIINAVDRAVAQAVLHRAPAPAKGPRFHPTPEFWYVLALVVLGLLVHYFAGPWSRLAFLFLVLAVGGLVMNVSLSIPWMADMLRFRFPPAANLHVFVLTLFVLLVTPLLGPIWCAHLCPFGALQELLSRVGARLHLLRNPAPRVEKAMRGTRYVLLLMVVLTLYGSNPGQIAKIDPMSTVFSGHLFGAALGLSILLCGAALFNYRFYCRNLCPVGAFLSVLGGISGLFGLRPVRDFKRCDLNVQGHWDHDCMQCNRCIRELKGDTK